MNSSNFSVNSTDFLLRRFFIQGYLTFVQGFSYSRFLRSRKLFYSRMIYIQEKFYIQGFLSKVFYGIYSNPRSKKTP